MLETFVDSQHHAGTIYRADNWQMVGETRGYRRIGGGYSQVPVESVKFVFVQAFAARCAAHPVCAATCTRIPAWSGENETDRKRLQVAA